ncbi:MAG TPA: asparagine synthase (glutamine-hydrolyzing) [Thermoanaerobaculia bacterium]|nr:asparagine synthase (glutamine-hydrolyzing) [Thermoanaerobaculia bacterium]
MCGISGVVGAPMAGEELSSLVERMGRTLHHRGPDDFGAIVDNAWGSGIACCRLAISDPARGRQPMENEDGTVAVVSNGEIYNHRELRAELIARGHRFKSACDTEVIVHLYEEHGLDFVDPLRGMFGIAVLDRRRRRVVLARDRIGMKPLYYAASPGGVVFGSEIKPLFASGLVAPAPDYAGIDTFLSCGYVPSPRTCFAGVSKVRPGELCVVAGGKVESRTYWLFEYEEPRLDAGDRELADELDSLLHAAVRDHLAADVPVGVLASGGLDSTLVALHAASVLGRSPPLFTVVQPESPAFDEGPPARALARALGAEHHEIEFRGADIPELLPAVVRNLDTPCVAAPAMLQYRLAQETSASVKAVIGGEGSDELFAGYPWFGGEWRWTLRRLVPRALLRAPAQRVTQIQWGRFLRMLAAEDDGAADREQYRLLTGIEQQRILAWDRPRDADLAPLRLDSRTEASCRDGLERKLALEVTRRLPDGLLMVNDRVQMAHALEVRMPFLDARIVDFARRLSSRFKLRDGQEKFILKLLADPTARGAGGRQPVPPEIARRRKFGLQTPMNLHLGGPLRGWVRELLLDAPDGEPFRRAALEPLLDAWLDDQRRDRHLRRPLCLLYLQAWWNEFFR